MFNSASKVNAGFASPRVMMASLARAGFASPRVMIASLARAGIASESITTAIGERPTVRFVLCPSQASGTPRNAECGLAHLPHSTGLKGQPVSNRASGPDLNWNPVFI